MSDPTRKGKPYGTPSPHPSADSGLVRRDGLAIEVEYAGRWHRCDFSMFANAKSTLIARPRLIEELVDQLVWEARRGKVATLARGATRHMIRALFFYLDAAESAAPVRSLSDLTDFHGELWAKTNRHLGYLGNVRAIVNGARQRQGHPIVEWPIRPRSRLPSHLPRGCDVQIIYRELRAQVSPILSTWEAGHQKDEAPPKRQVLLLLWLFMIQTGWNMSTALDLDITGRWTWDHPQDSRLKILQSIKRRPRPSTQWALSDNALPTAPHHLINCLINRTRQARRVAVDQLHLSRQSSALGRSPGTQRGVVSRAMESSPWLYKNPITASGVDALSRLNYFELGRRIGYTGNGDVGTTTDAWRQFLYRLNTHRAEQNLPLVEFRITLSDLRDAYIGQIYRFSGGNCLAAAAAAGHTNLASTQHYLSHVENAREAAVRTRNLQRVMWERFA